MKRHVTSLLAAAAFLPLAAVALAQQASLPGGATNLNETHGDWRTICSTTAEGEPNCSFVQERVTGQNGQRLLAVELRPNGGGYQGTLVMPFGLALPYGVGLQVDDLEPMRIAPFQTCLYSGCLVPITFNPADGEALRAGRVLRLLARGNDGSEVILELSLNGFTAAAQRVAELDPA